MSGTCLTCTCAAPPPPVKAGRLVLATRVDHLATVLRSLASRLGTPLRVLAAPGVLELRSPDVDAFLMHAGKELSRGEAEEVRALVVDDEVSDTGLMAAAMFAPSLRVATARVTHAELLPLFIDEVASFYSVYQPIVGLEGRDVIAHEALLRGADADGEEVMPTPLFAAAEDAGWTNLLDRIGRTTALRGTQSWLGDKLLFINFVPSSIYRPQTCLRTTEKAAADAGLPLEQLVFEVTEGHLVNDIDHLQDVFAYYRSRGCKVALDDLGSGYSTLNLLVRLQPDVVKIDREVIHSLPAAVATAVVSAVVDITHSYGGQVLAEGVESEEQAAAALALGVDLGQGWLFGHPVRQPPPVAIDVGRLPATG